MLGTGGFLRVWTALDARRRPSRNSRQPSTFRTVISGWESGRPRGRMQANLRRFRESSEKDPNRDDGPYRCFWSVCYGKARRLFLAPSLPRSVGFLPVFSPPEPSLAQHRVGALPLPLHPAEFVALGDQHGPDLLEDPALDPPLEPVVDGAPGAVSLGQPLPLAAAPHPEEDGVEQLPPVGDMAAGNLPGPELLEDRLDPPPQLVGEPLDRAQRLAADSSAAHDSAPDASYEGSVIRHNLFYAKTVPPILG
jgi:hypothetical protein